MISYCCCLHEQQTNDNTLVTINVYLVPNPTPTTAEWIDREHTRVTRRAETAMTSGTNYPYRTYPTGGELSFILFIVSWTCVQARREGGKLVLMWLEHSSGLSS